MVDDLNIQRLSKKLLKATLKKYPALFGGGQGKLNMEPVSVKLKKCSNLYQGCQYNIPKEYEQPTQKEIDWIMAVDLLWKLL